MHLSMHTALPLSVKLSLDLVMLQTERPQVLRLVGVRLPAEDTPRTYMVHMPRFECDFRAAVSPLARVVITGHDLSASVLRPFPGLDDQPVLPLGKFLPGQGLRAGIRVREWSETTSRATRLEVRVHHQPRRGRPQCRTLTESHDGTLAGDLGLTCKPVGRQPVDLVLDSTELGRGPTRGLVVATPSRDDLVDLRDLQRHRIHVR